MAWNRVVSHYLNTLAPGTGGRVLLDRLSSSSLQDIPTYIQADCFPIRLWFREPVLGAGQTSTAVQLPSGSSIVLGAKAKDNPGSLLFSATSFTEIEESGNWFYEALLDLNTAPLNSLLEALTSPLLVTVDVEVQNPGNSQRTTFQFDAAIRRQAYAGEAEPNPSVPPATFVFQSPTDGNYRFKNGTEFQLRETGPTPGFRSVWFVDGGLVAGPLES